MEIVGVIEFPAELFGKDFADGRLPRPSNSRYYQNHLIGIKRTFVFNRVFLAFCSLTEITLTGRD